jgi:hypothetical protein
VTDFPDPFDPFEALRSAGRSAVLPTAVEVRRLGGRRQVRARVLTGVGAAVVLGSGAGVAAAVGQDSAPAQPGLGTGSSTVSPDLRAVPSAVPAQPTAEPVPPVPTGEPVPPVPTAAVHPVVPEAPCPTDATCPPMSLPAASTPTAPEPTAVPVTASG